MTSYYYFDDPESEFGSTPVPEDDYVEAIFKIAKRNGVKITQEMIFEEIRKKWTKKRRN